MQGALCPGLGTLPVPSDVLAHTSSSEKGGGDKPFTQYCNSWGQQQKSLSSFIPQTSFSLLGWLQLAPHPRGLGMVKVHPQACVETMVCAAFWLNCFTSRGWKNNFWLPFLQLAPPVNVRHPLPLSCSTKRAPKKSPKVRQYRDRLCCSWEGYTHHPNSWHSHRNHGGKREKPQKTDRIKHTWWNLQFWGKKPACASSSPAFQQLRHTGLIQVTPNWCW